MPRKSAPTTRSPLGRMTETGCRFFANTGQTVEPAKLRSPWPTGRPSHAMVATYLFETGPGNPTGSQIEIGANMQDFCCRIAAIEPQRLL